jgi:hypothetical protein
MSQRLHRFDVVHAASGFHSVKAFTSPDTTRHELQWQ